MTTAITHRTSANLTAAIAYGGEFNDWRFESAEVEPGTAWDDIVTYHGKAAGRDEILLGYLVASDERKPSLYWDLSEAGMDYDARDAAEDTTPDLLEVVLTRELHEAHSA